MRESARSKCVSIKMGDEKKGVSHNFPRKAKRERKELKKMHSESAIHRTSLSVFKDASQLTRLLSLARWEKRRRYDGRQLSTRKYYY